jgi:hypothetical protein
LNQHQQEIIRTEQEKITQLLEQDRKKDLEQKARNQVRQEEYRKTLADQIVDLQHRKRAEEERLQKEIEQFKAQEQQYTEIVKREIEFVGQRK